MKHKHYDCIVAWAEGKSVQYLYVNGEWKDLPPITALGSPMWNNNRLYRIKPEPKPDALVLVHPLAFAANDWRESPAMARALLSPLSSITD